MIAYLKGLLLRQLPTGVILDVKGVGYELNLALPAIASLPEPGQPLEFFVFTRVREDELKLYGFQSQEEHQTFSVLIQINGVGPRVALAILSSMSVASLRSCVERDEPEALYPVPGIGKRTAEKILLELKGRLDRLPAGQVPGRPGQGALVSEARDADNWSQNLEPDLWSALENLGFRSKDIQPVLRELKDQYRGEDFSALIKKSLTMISGGSKQGRVATRKKSTLEELF